MKGELQYTNPNRQPYHNLGQSRENGSCPMSMMHGQGGRKKKKKKKKKKCVCACVCVCVHACGTRLCVCIYCTCMYINISHIERTVSV